MANFDATRAGFGYEKPNEGQSVSWITPKGLIDILGPFDLDPCEDDQQPWPCATKGYRLGRGEDGLVLPWQGRVFCNPPYGNGVELPWAVRMLEHRNGILLIFTRTETDSWRTVWKADAVFFPHGRICFCRPSGQRAKSGTAPSALLAYGERNVECLRNCGLAGTFITGHVILEGKKVSTL